MVTTPNDFRGWSAGKAKLVRGLKLKTSNVVEAERDGHAMARKLNAMGRVVEDDMSKTDTDSIVWQPVRGGRKARFGAGWLISTVAGGICYVPDAN